MHPPTSGISSDRSIPPFRLPILWYRTLFYDVAMKYRRSIIDKFCRVIAFKAGMNLPFSSELSFRQLVKFFDTDSLSRSTRWKSLVN